MLRLPPRSTRTDTLFPYTTLFRSVEIAVSYVAGGAATALFEGLDEGDHVEASGPFGRFCLMPADDNRRYLLIGTGTGITPYRAMLPLLEKQMAQRGVEVVLLQGARSPGELLYGDEFRAFANAHPGFRYLPCLSRELPEPGSPPAHPDGCHGYVEAEEHTSELPSPMRNSSAVLC